MWMDEMDSQALDAYVAGLEEDSHRYGFGPASPPSRKIDSGSPTVDKAKYGYEEAFPTVRKVHSEFNLRQPSHKTMQPRRSSMKQNGQSRRNSCSSKEAVEMEINIRGRKETVRRHRSIGFNETSDVRYIEPVSSLTDQPKNLWFSPEELNVIKHDRDIIVQLMKRGEKECDDLCARGLERFLQPKSTKRMNKNACIFVLLEQEDQQLSGTFNEHRISKLYQDLSKHSRKQAAKLAARDAAAIKDYLYSTSSCHLNHMRRSSC